MANPRIKPKRSSVLRNAPSGADLEMGEFAINLEDQKYYTKNDAGLITQIDKTKSEVLEMIPQYQKYEVQEFDSIDTFPESGNDSVMYIAKNTNVIYRYKQILSSGGFDWIVGTGGDFATLHEAMASSLVLDGHNILLKNGNYVFTETLVINKQVKIYGEIDFSNQFSQNYNIESAVSIIDSTNSVDARLGLWFIGSTLICETQLSPMVRIEADNVLFMLTSIENRDINSDPTLPAIVVAKAGDVSIRPSGVSIQTCHISGYSTMLDLRHNGFNLLNSVVYTSYPEGTAIVLRGNAGVFNVSNVVYDPHFSTPDSWNGVGEMNAGSFDREFIKVIRDQSTDKVSGIIYVNGFRDVNYVTVRRSPYFMSLSGDTNQTTYKRLLYVNNFDAVNVSAKLHLITLDCVVASSNRAPIMLHGYKYQFANVIGSISISEMETRGDGENVSYGMFIATKTDANNTSFRNSTALNIYVGRKVGGSYTQISGYMTPDMQPVPLDPSVAYKLPTTATTLAGASKAVWNYDYGSSPLVFDQTVNQTTIGIKLWNSETDFPAADTERILVDAMPTQVNYFDNASGYYTQSGASSGYYRVGGEPVITTLDGGSY